MTDGALTGVRVLDAAILYPAPLLAAMLGDFGADVVKVEPLGGDPLRAMGSVPWAIAGRNKRSVRLDLDTAEGLDMLQRLAAAADVVVLNQPAPLLARWGCTDAELAARNPGAIVVHVSTFGTTGPLGDRVGNGTLAEAFVGLPPDLGVPLGDTVGAQHGVSAVLAALYRRERDRERRGCVVDVRLYEGLLALVAPRAAGADTTAMIRQRHRAGDGREIAVSATTPAQRERLDALTGGDLGRWVEARASVDAVDELTSARVPAVVVNDMERVLGGAHPRPTAPDLGAHTQEVVEEWLDGSTGSQLRQR